jgi:hypothetical protein
MVVYDVTVIHGLSILVTLAIATAMVQLPVKPLSVLLSELALRLINESSN